MERVQVRTVCPHDCPDTCSVIASIEDGRLVRVAGDPDHPFTGGFLCAKVNRYPERVHSPERVLAPLRRSGPKGGGSWRQISWDEALDEIAERWRAVRERWGSEAVMAYVYSGNMGLVGRNLPRALFHALGTTQVKAGTVCDTTAEAGWEAAYGPVAPLDPESVAEADLVVAWGSDIATTNVHLWPFVERARRRGAQLISIAPYRTRTARHSDHFLAVRIATDAALALGVAHVLFRDGRASIEFLRREAEGWERWVESTLPRYSPEFVESVTGVPAEEVEALARRLAGARAPFIRIGAGLSRHAAGGRAVRAIALLPAVLGVWGRPGAGALLETSYGFPLDYEAIRRTDLLPHPVRTVNHAQLGFALTELQDPPVKALLVMSNNPAVTCPDAGRIRQGLMRDDLFTVVHDTFMTDTAALADLVLPACTAFESEDVYRSYGHLYMQYARPVIPPIGESRPNAWLARELAARLGVRHEVFSRSVADHVRALLPDRPATVERVLGGEPVKFEPTGGPGRWATPSGKISFVPPPDFSPDFAPGSEPLAAPGRQLLRLLVGPGHFLSHTGFEGVEELRRRAGEPRCLLNPEEARARAIRDGDAVELRNERGHVGMLATLSEDVPPGLAVVEGIRPASAYRSGGPINVLTSETLADMGEGATYLSTWVDVMPDADCDVRAG